MLTRVVVGRILASEMVSKPNAPRTICVLAFFIVASGVWGEDSITLASHLPDNDLHSLAGLSIAFLAAGAAANLGISPAVASLLALSSAILAGAAKKVADAAGFGHRNCATFSTRPRVDSSPRPESCLRWSQSPQTNSRRWRPQRHLFRLPFSPQCP